MHDDLVIKSEEKIQISQLFLVYLCHTIILEWFISTKNKFYILEIIPFMSVTLRLHRC